MIQPAACLIEDRPPVSFCMAHPFLIGFGISNRATHEAADACSAGVIVGSRFVSLLEQLAHPAEAVEALHRILAT